MSRMKANYRIGGHDNSPKELKGHGSKEKYYSVILIYEN